MRRGGGPPGTAGGTEGENRCRLAEGLCRLTCGAGSPAAPQAGAGSWRGAPLGTPGHGQPSWCSLVSDPSREEHVARLAHDRAARQDVCHLLLDGAGLSAHVRLCGQRQGELQSGQLNHGGAPRLQSGLFHRRLNACAQAVIELQQCRFSLKNFAWNDHWTMLVSYGFLKEVRRVVPPPKAAGRGK